MTANVKWILLLRPPPLPPLIPVSEIEWIAKTEFSVSHCIPSFGGVYHACTPLFRSVYHRCVPLRWGFWTLTLDLKNVTLDLRFF